MNRMTSLCLCVLMPVVIFGQAQWTATLPLQKHNFSPSSAVYQWLLAYETSVQDSAFPLYINQSVQWTKHFSLYGIEADSLIHTFVCDSIKGRGDKRIAYIRLVRKFPSSPDYWIETSEDTAGNVIVKRQTTDSTYHVGKWCRPTSTVVVNGQRTTVAGDGATIGFRDTTKLRWYFKRVVGNPLINNGFSQRAEIHLSYYQTLPVDLYVSDASSSAFSALNDARKIVGLYQVFSGAVGSVREHAENLLQAAQSAYVENKYEECSALAKESSRVVLVALP